jgi:diguanylate cyclase (GGDEF)-like protein
MNKNVDSLTNLPNRKAMEVQLIELIGKEEPVALALLDVDHFKEINDGLGHEVGDEVLQTLGKLMQEVVPGGAYRISGDEFAVVMHEDSLEQAFLKMERLRLKVHESQSAFPMPEGHEMSITIGVAQYPRDAKDWESLNRAANAAMMAAKEIGRNQVALPPNEEMVMKSCYYPSTSVRRLKALAESTKKKESMLLREALADLLRKYDQVIK